MKVKIKENIEKYKNIMKIFGSIGSEIMIKVEKEKMNFYTSSGGIIAGFGELKKDFFDEFNIEEENEDLGIETADIKIPLKNIKNEIVIHTKDNYLYQEGDNIKYRTPIYDKIEYMEKQPNVEYNDYIELTLSDIKNIIDKTKDMSEDTIEFKIKDKKLIIVSEKNKKKIELFIKETTQEDKKILIKKEQLLILSHASNEKIKLFLEESKPIKIEHENFNVYIAPIIE